MAQQIVGEQDDLGRFLRIGIVHKAMCWWVPMDADRTREEVHSTRSLSRWKTRICQWSAGLERLLHKVDSYQATDRGRVESNAIFHFAHGRDDGQVVLASTKRGDHLPGQVGIKAGCSQQAERPGVGHVGRQINLQPSASERIPAHVYRVRCDEALA